MKYVIAFVAAFWLSGVAAGHPKSKHGEDAVQVGAVAPSAKQAARVVDAFHAALQRGDTKAALSYLAGNALIYESGGVERGRQEYASHHLGADAAFAQAVPGTITRRAGHAVGNLAWVATEGRTTGSFKEKAVDRVTTETMVLLRTGGAWKIVHIHWSSAAGAK